MSKGRMVLTIVVAVVVSEILGGVVHGFVLSGDYAPFYGQLLRSQPGIPMLLLPVAHLSAVAALVWIFGRLELKGGTAAQGVTLGLIGFFAGQAPLWLIWYAEQPWPVSLVVKQLALELVSSLIIGMTIVAVSGRRNAQARVPSAV